MLKTAQSQATTVAAAVADIQAQLGADDYSLVVFFHSPALPADRVAEQIHAAFPSATTLGCTTAGEITSKAMLKGALVAMAFPRSLVTKVGVAVAENLDREASAIRGAVASLSQTMGDLLAIPGDTHVGLVLTDGLSGAEESVMARLGELTEVRFVGGSAGDDLAFKETFVSLNGRAYRQATVLAVLEVPRGYQVIKTQSFCRKLAQLTPTKVDEATRTVLEFDGKPAGEAYREAVGAASLDAATARFMENPVALMDGDEPYVRSPQQIVGGAMRFYCAVNEGIPLSLLEGTDIVADTAAAVRAAQEAHPLAGVLDFHCILRTLGLQAQGRTQDYADIFQDVPMIGFSTYGEADFGHINQTSTMIAFHQ